MKKRDKTDLPPFSWKEIDDLFETARPSLSEDERTFIKEAIVFARLANDIRLRSIIGVWLTALIADEKDERVFVRYENTPPLDPKSHNIILGFIGTGKTTMANIGHIKLALEHDDLTQLIFETESDRAQYIITALESHGKEWLYFDASTIRENIYELAQYHPTWFEFLSRVFNEMGMYGDTGSGRMHYVFTNVNGIEMIRQRGGLATFNETVQYTRDMRVPKGSNLERYRDTLLVRFEDWVPDIGDILNYRRGYPWESYHNKTTIFDLAELTRKAQIFFMNYWLAKLIFLGNRKLIPPGGVLCSVDEYHKFIASAEQKMKNRDILPLIMEFPLLSRKRGCFIVIINQPYSMIPEFVTSQCANKIFFRMQGKTDLKAIIDELNLTSDQGAALSKLDDRECIWIGKGMKEPVLCQVEDSYRMMK